MTLDEIFADENNKLGETKVRLCHWREEEYFIPSYRTKSKYYHGLDEKVFSLNMHATDSVLFELYKEPKPTVMRAPYLFQYKGNKVPEITEFYIKDEEELRDNYSLNAVEWFKRLDKLEVECES